MLCLAVPLWLAPPAHAQETADARLRAERARLDSIRRERTALQERMQELQTSVHSLSEEVTNMNRQAAMTARLVHSLDAQLATIGSEVAAANDQLARAEQELVDRRAALRKRVVSIYKRGPLYNYEVLLSAESFGTLLARYKYLRLLALRDRALVSRVEKLRDDIRQQRGNLVRFQQTMELTRQEKLDEEQRLQLLTRQRSTSLADTRRRAREAEQRLRVIQRDEERLNSMIGSIERTRVNTERAAPNAPRTPSTLKTSDLGRLDWPVEGTIIYSYGKVVSPNNTTTKWNGLGIAAATGTPVKAVAAGRVMVAEPFGGYGLTVILQHGGGDYSVYGSLNTIAVQKGALVSKGQVVGGVGTSDPDLGPHVHFEIRPGGHAVDPLEWLRGVR